MYKLKSHKKIYKSLIFKHGFYQWDESEPGRICIIFRDFSTLELISHECGKIHERWRGKTWHCWFREEIPEPSEKGKIRKIFSWWPVGQSAHSSQPVACRIKTKFAFPYLSDTSNVSTHLRIIANSWICMRIQRVLGVGAAQIPAFLAGAGP